jgi:hypothetical protein
MVTSYLSPVTDKERASLDNLRKKLEGVTLEVDDTSFLLDDALFLRYLRHKDGAEEKALKSILECLEWRKTFKPHHIKLEDVWEWASEGVSFCTGVTKQGIPILNVRPVSGLKVDIDMRLRYACWLYEELMRRGYYEVVFVGDFSAVTASPTADEKKVREQIDDTRSRYYPLFETKLFFVSMPLILRVIFSIMTAFMSGAQKETMHTGLKPKHLLEWIDESELLDRLGGKRAVITKKEGERAVPEILTMIPVSIKA